MVVVLVGALLDIRKAGLPCGLPCEGVVSGKFIC